MTLCTLVAIASLTASAEAQPSQSAAGTLPARSTSEFFDAFESTVEQTSPTAPVVSFDGPPFVEYLPMSRADRRAHYLAKLGQGHDAFVAHRLNMIDGTAAAAVRVPAVAARVYQAAAGQSTIDVMLTLRSHPTWSVSRAVQRGLQDQIYTFATVGQARRDLQALHRAEVLGLQTPIVQLIEATGGQVLERFYVGNIVFARVNTLILAALASNPDVKRISLPYVAGGPEDIDGYESTLGTEVHQFLIRDLDGRVPNPHRHKHSRLTLAVIDSAFDSSIYAWKSSSSGASRVISMWDCSADPCVQVDRMEPMPKDFGNPTRWLDHGTMVAGIAAGDLTHFQDPIVNSSTEQQRRSGFARGAGLFLISISDDPEVPVQEPNVVRAIQLASELWADVAVYSGGAGYEQNCLTDTPATEAVNHAALYYDMLFVKSAGNDDHELGDGCTVTCPGAAAWAFPVGGTLNSPEGDYSVVRDAEIYESSSQGGAPYMEGSRAIIGLVAPAVAALTPNFKNQYSTTYHVDSFGTSWAAPRVAGLAIDHINLMLNYDQYSIYSIIAGAVQADLMLMGDRYREDISGQNGEYLVRGQDNLWGGGRLRAKMFTDAGMSGEWNWTHGATPVVDGLRSEIEINEGKPLPEEANRLKIAVWWPEPNLANHEEEGANITVELVRTCGYGPEGEDTSPDPRKMIYLEGSSIGKTCYKLVIRGVTVPPSPWYNGAKLRQAFYAYYYESETP